MKINGAQIPNSWSGRGIYCNGSDTSVAFNGITIPAFKVLFPDNTSIDLQSYSGITGITFTGSDLTNDYFNGGVGNDVINGGDGNDTINGGGGNDTINAGDGDDVVIYKGEGNDTVTFGAGNDTLKVSNITGWSEYRDGDDLIIYAANGTNFIKVVGAYSTANRLENIEYTDSSVVRLVSVNSLVPSSGIHFFAGTSGDDTINGGSASSVSATGYDGNDTLIGTSGRDYYGGNAGDDIIKTLAGDDVLIGGTGNDTLEGGDGSILSLPLMVEAVMTPLTQVMGMMLLILQLMEHGESKPGTSMPQKRFSKVSISGKNQFTDVIDGSSGAIPLISLQALMLFFYMMHLRLSFRSISI